MHKYGKDDPCSCNGISVSQANVVSAGEDGRINVIQLERKDPFRVIGKHVFHFQLSNSVN